MDLDFAAIEATWRFRLPPELSELDAIKWNALRLPNGDVIAARFACLTTQELVSAHALADDWQIEDGLLPIMGDFHDLVCLDYRRSPVPAVIGINDERKITFSFSDFDAFMAAREHIPETPSNLSNVIQSNTWLNF